MAYAELGAVCYKIGIGVYEVPSQIMWMSVLMNFYNHTMLINVENNEF